MFTTDAGDYASDKVFRVKMLVNQAFQVKLGLLVSLALAWHVLVQQRVRSWGRESDTPLSPNSAVWSKY